jgi:phosphatidylserine/phosphatidylglycerophosphate/cardiolipin synthase-like enzyme
MHNKFWVFDQEIVWTGSTNATVNGALRNNNNVLVIRSPRVAAIYEREFGEMWDGAFGPTSPSTVEDQSATINGTSVQILFAPEDRAIDRIRELVDQARYSVRFMAFSFTHHGLSDAVLGRARAGVEVEGIFETRGSESAYSQLTALHCAGVSVRQDGNAAMFHHKVFIIDDEIVITGSLNYSENADQSNDENVVITVNRDIAAEYVLEFRRRWEEGAVPLTSLASCD